jgi:hypothetical protein
MKMAARHKKLVTDFPGMKMGDANIQRPLSLRRLKHLNVINTPLRIETLPCVAVGKHIFKTAKGGGFTDNRPAGKHPAGPCHLEWQVD